MKIEHRLDIKFLKKEGIMERLDGVYGRNYTYYSEVKDRQNVQQKSLEYDAKPGIPAAVIKWPL